MAMPKRDAPAETAPRESKLRWLLGWVVTPGVLLAALFLSGVHLGARNPEMWLSRLMLWLFG